jgi:hypothetical protein
MSTPELRQDVSAVVPPAAENAQHVTADPPQRRRKAVGMWMALDGLTVLEAAVLAVLFKSHAGLFHEDKILWSGALIRGRSMPILLLLLFWYALWLIIFSRRLNLYHPRRLQSFLLEHRLIADWHALLDSRR